MIRTIDPTLLARLTCPVCGGQAHLIDAQDDLSCAKCGRRYPVNDGIPDLLPGSASLPERTHTEEE